MQVSAISNQNFTGKRDNIDNFIALDDSQIRLYAVKQAQEKNQKKAKQLRRLLYATPLIALGAASLTHGGKETSVLGSKVGGRAANIAKGLGAGGYWAFLLGTGALIAGINNKIESKHPKYEEFNRNHPVLSILGEIAVFMGIVSLAAPLAVGKLASKIGPKTSEKISTSITATAAKINGMKGPKFLSNFAGKIKNSKIGQKLIPAEDSKISNLFKSEGLKRFINWLPSINLFGTVLGLIGLGGKFSRDANKVYMDIKDKQQQLTNARMAELKNAAMVQEEAVVE